MKNIMYFLRLVVVLVSSCFVLNADDKIVLNENFKEQKLEKDQSVDIQKLLKEYAENSAAVGVVVGLFENDQVKYYFHGNKSVNNSETLTKESVFEIGSITKVFTTLVLMELVKEGKIDLDEPIETYLKEVKIPQRNGKKITFRHLATHTSGLPCIPINMDLSDSKNAYENYSVASLYDYLSTCDLQKDPGEQFEYSNLGMGLLGHILCLVTNQSYDSLIQKRICTQLELKSTSCLWSSSMKKNLVLGHHMKKADYNWNFSSSPLVGCGALKSNLKDITTFLIANMGMLDTQLSDSMTNCHQTHHTQSSAGSIGLGWMKTCNNESQIIWHNGGTGGFRSFIGFRGGKNPKGVVILSNSTDGLPDNLGFHILDPKNNKSPISVFDETYASSDYLNQFVGQYELKVAEGVPVLNLEVLAFGKQLIVFHPEIYNFYLVAEKENLFQCKEDPSIKFQFILDENRDAVKMQCITPEGRYDCIKKRLGKA